jgi:hypothetical protein
MKTFTLVAFACLAYTCMLAQSSGIRDSVLAAAVNMMIDEYQLQRHKNDCIVVKILSLDEDVELPEQQSDTTVNGEIFRKAKIYYSVFIRAQRGLWDSSRITDFTFIRGIPIVFETSIQYLIRPNPKRVKYLEKKLPVLPPGGGMYDVWKLEVDGRGITLEKKPH